ncbi:SDR family NAD(P)-dependent oxidoreductase [Alkalicoccus chagannorensis]|uniref:SDR family NAD(P)-dependent oxidoreductase n=1 Tax=Alkalicoccus chagannorensis TaxID=427072 RepID=UPI00040DC290|nr:SDR family NAD(P)-dependent oxidoreductase [Alkalicoccus chagannorensis]
MNTNVLITGGSSGIGASLALELAENGYHPIICGRSEEKLIRTQKLIYHRCGVLIEAFQFSVDRLDELPGFYKEVERKAGPVDVVINNAGAAVFDAVVDITTEDAEQMMQLNVLAPVILSREAANSMIRRGAEGQILFTGSLAGKIATPKSSVYAASKHALQGFVQAFRMEMTSHGIHVGIVNPGPVDTPFFEGADQDGSYAAEVSNLMRRPEEVAVLFRKMIAGRVREISIPWWMGAAARIYQAAPVLVERLGSRYFHKK